MNRAETVDRVFLLKALEDRRIPFPEFSSFFPSKWIVSQTIDPEYVVILEADSSFMFVMFGNINAWISG